MQVLTVRPELAALTTFSSGQSIVHIASGQQLGSTFSTNASMRQAGASCLRRFWVSTGVVATAANGDREVLQAVVDVLQSAAKSPLPGSDGDLKEQTLNAVTMGRYLKDVLNTRNRTGQTPLMLACSNGCALPLSKISNFQYSISKPIVVLPHRRCALSVHGPNT